MTHFEFWTNLATVILLVPATILSFRLSRQLGKLNKNQERMIELAAALRRAAETYGADNGRRDCGQHRPFGRSACRRFGIACYTAGGRTTGDRGKRTAF